MEKRNEITKRIAEFEQIHRTCPEYAQWRLSVEITLILLDIRELLKKKGGVK